MSLLNNLFPSLNHLKCQEFTFAFLLATKYTNPQIYLIESLYWEHGLRFRFSRARDRGVAASGWLRHHR